MALAATVRGSTTAAGRSTTAAEGSTTAAGGLTTAAEGSTTATGHSIVRVYHPFKAIEVPSIVIKYYEAVSEIKEEFFNNFSIPNTAIPFLIRFATRVIIKNSKQGGTEQTFNKIKRRRQSA